MDLIRISKYISLLLRHKPEVAGLRLDEKGWCDVETLIQAVGHKYAGFNREVLDEIVETNNKHRFSYDENHSRIRANQGHSIAVDVELEQCQPPEFLYHGTATKYEASISKQGLVKGRRLYVHLSKDIPTAISVGSRHGNPIVFEVAAKAMAADGFIFFLSKNGVWLTNNVPIKYLKNIL